MLGRDRRNFVLTDEGVAADEHRRRDRLLPARLRSVPGIAPQGVVVAVGNRDVAERVVRRQRVVRRHRVRLGNPDARAESFDSFVGDAAGVAHASETISKRFARLGCRAVSTVDAQRRSATGTVPAAVLTLGALTLAIGGVLGAMWMLHPYVRKWDLADLAVYRA